jgi:hypothetical protein
MSQPTQNPARVRNTRGADTPQQARADSPFRTRLSFSARHEVQWLRDQRRQLISTTNFPRAQACPTPPQGADDGSRIFFQEMLEGRPETLISMTPLTA